MKNSQINDAKRTFANSNQHHRLNGHRNIISFQSQLMEMPFGERKKFLRALDKDSGDAPLHSAIKSNDLEMVRLLVTYGADLNLLNADGFSPLVLSEQSGGKEVRAYIDFCLTIQERLDGLDISMVYDFPTIMEALEKTNVATKSAAGKSLGLALGPTGIGKSTFLNYISGVKYEPSKRGKIIKHLDVVEGEGECEEVLTVGHNGVVSETLYPQVISVQNNRGDDYYFSDLAGWKSTERSEFDLVGSMGAHMITMASESIQSLLVFVEPGNIGAIRAENFKNSLEIIMNVYEQQSNDGFSFEAFNTFLDSVIIVMTKANGEEDKSELLSVIDEMLEGLYENMESLRDYKMLAMLSYFKDRTESIFVPDVTDNGQSREAFFTLLEDRPKINPEDLNFIAMTDSQQEFHSILFTYVDEFNRRFERVTEVIPGEIQSISNQINHETAFLKEMKEQNQALEVLLFDTREDISEAKESFDLNNELVKIIDSKINLLTQERSEIDASIERYRSERKLLDTDDLVKYKSLSYAHVEEFEVVTVRNDKQEADIERAANQLGSSVKSEFGNYVNNEIVKTGGNILIDVVAAGLSNLFSTKKQRLVKKRGEVAYTFSSEGTYIPAEIKTVELHVNTGDVKKGKLLLRENAFEQTITHSAGENVRVEARIMVEKRTLPENVRKMKECDKAIVKLELESRNFSRELDLLQDQREVLVSDKNKIESESIKNIVDLEQFQANISQGLDFIETSEQKIISLNESRDDLLLQRKNDYEVLVVNKEMYASIAGIATILDLGDVDDRYEYFLESYTDFAYEGVCDMECDDLSGKSFPLNDASEDIFSILPGANAYVMAGDLQDNPYILTNGLLNLVDAMPQPLGWDGIGNNQLVRQYANEIDSIGGLVLGCTLILMLNKLFRWVRGCINDLSEERSIANGSLRSQTAFFSVPDARMEVVDEANASVAQHFSA